MLKQYSKLIEEIQQLKQHEIFKKYEELEAKRIELEEQIRAEARDKGDMEYENIKVKVIHKWRKSYNYEKFSPEEKQVIAKAGGVKLINKVVEELTEKGLVSKENRMLAYQEEELTPSVMIKYGNTKV